MVILLLIILVIVIGKSYVNEGKFAVVTGSLTVNASSEGNTSINYPSGFSASNSVVISVGLMVGEPSGYNYSGFYRNSGDSFANAFYRRVNLKSDGIKLMIDNPNDASLTAQYKIVLMKIN